MVSLLITDVIKPEGFKSGGKIYFYLLKSAIVLFIMKKFSTGLNLLQLIAIVVMRPEILLV